MELYCESVLDENTNKHEEPSKHYSCSSSSGGNSTVRKAISISEKLGQDVCNEVFQLPKQVWGPIKRGLFNNKKFKLPL